MRKGSKMKREARERISTALKGRALDPEWIRRRTAARRKNNPSWHSKETIEKIRAAATGVIPSMDTRRKIAASLRGRRKGLETTANLVWSLRGHKVSEEAREKISYGMKRYWEKKKVAMIKVDQDITDNLSEIREAARHKRERKKIERGD